MFSVCMSVCVAINVCFYVYIFLLLFLITVCVCAFYVLAAFYENTVYIDLRTLESGMLLKKAHRLTLTVLNPKSRLPIEKTSVKLATCIFSESTRDALRFYADNENKSNRRLHHLRHETSELDEREIASERKT